MTSLSLDIDLDRGLAAVADTEPLVHALTNDVTTNDVAQVILHWGGLPVMSQDEREVDDMIAGAAACLLNTGTLDADSEETMTRAGAAAAERGVPVVLDPVGAGATPTRSRVARRFATDLDPAVVKGNYGEVSALAGEDAAVRGVEAVGEYADVAETAVACAREFDTVVVASGETDVVATPDAALEISAGHPLMGAVVGTGCMLGATIATFAGAVDDPGRAAVLGTVAFGLAGEAAADGTFGDYHGPASYHTAFLDAVAGLDDVAVEDPAARVEPVLGQ
ncbi:MAG: hydroxyethylthiazole kinase [Haloarculaceae archaeon]